MHQLLIHDYPFLIAISITIDSDILKTIKQMAEEDDRSVSQYINIVLKDWITNETNDIQHTS
ncbi:ribbon-helix-helix protein, CopG family [Enterocloster hominis (ex Hitch et al. 2024)]|uniref:Ribbon-helix-helix protein, CopG family n=1 Tax=Enterocloster hominis (ex Hitch et al. 2024) TaxID=1917870 RepID=A0ABV1DBS8_9FIRM